MPPRSDELLALASEYLGRQGWFRQASAEEPPAVFEMERFVLIEAAPPGLARLVISRGDLYFQLLLGWRRSTEVTGVLRGEESALLGAVDDGDERLIVYDALADDELCRRILEVATDDREHAKRVRPVASLISHASLVFDERLFMKCYRVIEKATRPEIEVTFELDRVGFNSMLAPVARWRDDDLDLGLVREFQPSALEGRLLALTSLRDLLGHVSDGGYKEGEIDLDAVAAAAGGDLSGEAARLGTTTALLHLALARAFDARPADRDDFAGVAGLSGVAAVLDGAGPAGLGRAIRIHGDYHLRRVMRSEAGWLVAGFGDDPLYGVDAKAPSLEAHVGSPLEDLADMSFALSRVVEDALAQRGVAGHDRAVRLAAAWRRRNRSAFLRGYLRTDGIDELLPARDADRFVLLEALEELRERRYEATSLE